MYLKKHIEDDMEYISASDIFEFMNEEDRKTQEIFAFLSLVEKELNYFNFNTSTAFGNPDLEGIKGMVRGYCMAKNWDIVENKNFFIVKSGNRKKFIIEKPSISKCEIENRNDISEIFQTLGW